MPDRRTLETVLRATLAEQAAGVDAREEAMAAATAAVRRRQRLRRAGGTCGAAAAVVVVALAAVTLWSPVDTAAPGPAAATTASTAASVTASGTASSAPPRSTTSEPSASSSAPVVTGLLMSVFGPDWVAAPRGDGFGGDLVVTAGSPSAQGLPPGYSAGLTLWVDPGQSQVPGGTESTMTVLCRPLTEKGAVSTACAPYAYAGKTVQRTTTDAPNTKPGTWAMLRMLYARPDGRVQITSLTIYKTDRPTTAGERSSASAWLEAQADQVARATTATAW